MQSIQKDILGVLLRSVLAQGLITQSTYQRAVGLLATCAEFPDCFRHPAGTEEDPAG